MPHFELLEILALGFLGALVLGLITHRLKLSPIVGYLIAGFLLGPNSPGFVADAHLAGQLAEVGVILLMFGVGMHFDLKDLLAVKGIAVPGAILQSVVATGLGMLAASAVGLPLSAGLIIGLGLSVASTVVLMRILTDNDMLDTGEGHVVVGWLIVEDILTVLILVLLPSLAAIFAHREAAAGANMLAALGLAILKLAALWILVLPIGGRVIPWLLSHVARTRSRELFFLAVLVTAFVIAVGSAVALGASVALGAFLAGMVVGRTSSSHQAASDILPMRDAFGVLFFVSVGMLFDPALLARQPFLVVSGLVVILLAKPLTACLIVAGLGYSAKMALTVALGLAQIGEFSFILAQQALHLDLVGQDAFSLLVGLALISISLNPLVFKTLGPVERWLQRHERFRLFRDRRLKQGESAGDGRIPFGRQEDMSRAIVLGYGPVGQQVSHLLKELGVQPVIVDLNLDTVHKLLNEGERAVYGDGSQRGILMNAGIDRADYLLVTFPNLPQALQAVTTARELNARIEIVVRTRYLLSRTDLESRGASAVVTEEGEVTDAMLDVLRHLVENRKV